MTVMLHSVIKITEKVSLFTMLFEFSRQKSNFGCENSNIIFWLIKCPHAGETFLEIFKTLCSYFCDFRINEFNLINRK